MSISLTPLASLIKKLLPTQTAVQAETNTPAATPSVDYTGQEKELLKQLRELESKYREETAANAPKSSLELERVNPVVDSDEVLKQRAETEIEKNASAKIDSLAAQKDSSISVLDEKKDTLEVKKNDDIDALFAAIDALKRQADNDTLKRGLGRSSIATGRQDSLDQAKISGIEKYTMAFNKDTTDIDKKISELQSSFDKSVSTLEFDKAYDAEKKLAELKKERDKILADAAKYNNTLMEKENDYKMQYEKYVAAMKAEEEKNGMSGAKLANYNERYKLAYDFYASMNKSTAASLIANNSYLRTYLGTDLYDKLKNSFK